MASLTFIFIRALNHAANETFDEDDTNNYHQDDDRTQDRRDRTTCSSEENRLSATQEA